MMEDVGTSANKLIQLDSNAKIPAVDGSLLTNMVTALSASSDPTISTNPSGGVGTKYKNTTDGEIFICTDATAGENVWKNVGAGTGDIQPVSHAAGTNYGYIIGGSNSNIIDRYSYSTDGDSVDVANLSVSRYSCAAGAADTTHGYCAGAGPYPGSNNTIDRFSFAGGGNATDVGDTFEAHYMGGGGYSTTHGYIAGGQGIKTIQKYQLVASANGTDVGDLITVGQTGAGSSSETNGYNVGKSYHSGAGSENIEKYSFSTDGNSTDVGTLTGTVGLTHLAQGCQTTTHGYAVGHALNGYNGGNIIEKFAFANEGTTIDVGDLAEYIINNSASSSSTHGYSAGGTGVSPGPTGQRDTIEKFSFSAGGNSTDVGNLGSHRSGAAKVELSGGVQY
jgi:hypothetical protein